MYKIAGVGLIGLFIFMILPANIELTDTFLVDGTHYGAISLTVHDVNGNERFSQTIHNQLTNQGENFILNQTFTGDNGVLVDNQQIAVICVSDPNGLLQVSDLETAATFTGNNTIATDATHNCVQDESVDTDGGVATIGPLTFNATNTFGNVLAGDRIDGIGICQHNGSNSSAFSQCSTSGILFSVINTSNVTLAANEDIDITYTFDISDSEN